MLLLGAADVGLSPTVLGLLDCIVDVPPNLGLSATAAATVALFQYTAQHAGAEAAAEAGGRRYPSLAQRKMTPRKAEGNGARIKM